jgi:hypothetical protein
MKTVYAILLTVFSLSCLQAQVSEIKSASSSNSSGSNSKSGDGSYDSYDSDDEGGGLLIDFLFSGIIEAQTFKLQKDPERYPSMVSLEVMLQGGVKPSSYYMFWPRIRGNWGLFSTDFRMNYLIEEEANGYSHLRTNDWQIIQLNLITSRFFTFRVGTGFMQEAFGDKEVFSETALMFNVHAPDQTKQIGFEWRFAKDFETGSNPRWELSAQYQHQVFNSGKLHGYISAGTIFQKYYNYIEVWGMQAGLVLRFF